MYRPRRTLSILVGTVLSTFAVPVHTPLARADVKLPALFSDHAVLQRDMKVPVWGWAEPGEKVTVTVPKQHKSTTADADGKWRVTLDPLKVGKPFSLVVEGKNRVELKDVVAGEVWLCSGQSNMEWNVAAARDGDMEVAEANYPNLRMITVSTQGSQTPQDNFDGRWERCSPKTVGDFSAVGYFFGRDLLKCEQVPIGMIDNSWGASACEAWIRRDAMEGNPLYDETLARYDRLIAELNQTGKTDEERQAAWRKRAEAALQAHEPDPPGLSWWANPFTGQFRPANLYNGRIRPIMPYAIRGAIWYQGETNAGRSYQYRELFPLMIKSWRDEWGQGDFPFYWVQLADFMPEKDEPNESSWAELREAQTMAVDKVPHGGEAVIIDVGEANEIHPKNKQTVGRRLARLALAKTYGRKIAASSPRYDSIEHKGDAIVVHLRDVNGPLRTFDGKPVQGFAIAGADRKWVWADAKIVGDDQVEVRSDAVHEPVAVRYAWADNPVCNLYDTAGLPVTPFRTDEWPGVTANAK